SARRPELPELLRRAPRQQIRQGRALGRRRRRALRRLPVAVLPRPQRGRRGVLLPQLLRLLAAPRGRREEAGVLHATGAARRTGRRIVRRVPGGVPAAPGTHPYA